MVQVLAAALVALAAAQATDGSETPPAGAVVPEAAAVERPPPDPMNRFADPKQSGIPFQPYATPPGAETGGVSMDVGVESAFRAMSLSGNGADSTVGLDVEVAPGVSLVVDLPAYLLTAGYAARITIPIDATGPSTAVLNNAYVRMSWKTTPTWTLGLEGGVTAGDYSQLYPAVLPGGSGAQPTILTPVRSFATYPYLGWNVTVRAEDRVSPRDRLRLSAGYADSGGVGAAGDAGGAQPRTWGPIAEAAWDWEATRTSILSSSLSAVDTIMSGQFYILIGTLRETYALRLDEDLETLFTLGVALSNTDSITFLTVGHLLPVAGVALKYYTDSAHQLRLSVDANLSPYVDPYSRVAYQRMNASTALDWYPTATFFLGVNISAAWVPYAVQAPEAYGAGGVSAGWSIGKLVTLGAGAFSQIQFQGPESGSFRQWTAYVNVTLRDRVQY